MKYLNKKNLIFLSFLAIITLNIITVFLWQFASASINTITAPGGTINDSVPVESIIVAFGGPDAVSVIELDGSYKVIVKNDIKLTSSINITSGNFIIVAGNENVIIKRSLADDDENGIADFSAPLFNVTSGSLSFGEGIRDMGEDNISSDNIITNTMASTLTISGSIESTGGYINSLSGASTKPNVITSSGLIISNNSVVNIWKNVIIKDNYSNESTIFINSNSTLNISGSTIEKCVNTTSSIININNSVFNYYDGLINNNESNDNGIIYVNNNSTFNNYGGLITHNIDLNSNGAVLINASAFNMHGGTVYNNNENDLYFSSSAEGTINNGYIGNFSGSSNTSTLNLIAGTINSINPSSLANITHRGSTSVHHELTIPDASSNSSSDYVKIYKIDDNGISNFVTYYEGVFLSNITSLKFYLLPGNYKAIIDEVKTYYFTIADENLIVSPSGITAVNTTFGPNNDGVISGLSSNMEMSLDNTDFFELPSYPTIESVGIGDYYFRQVGSSSSVKISVKGTNGSVGGTLNSSSSVQAVMNAFNPVDYIDEASAVEVIKSGSKYTIILKSNIILEGMITINSGDYNIISDGANYTIKKDINSFTSDMFKINGGSLTLGSANVTNDVTSSVKYSFKNEEIITSIDESIPEKAVDYAHNTLVLTGIKNTMKGSVTIDGGTNLSGGYINNSLNGPSSPDAVSSGVIVNVNGGSFIMNEGVVLKNNYNNGTRINGSAIFVNTNATLKMYGGVITKCVRNSTVATNGAAIYNKGNTYIYNGEISYNETNSDLVANGTIYSESKLYIANINMHNNWVKSVAGGIYLSEGSVANIYNGIINNNISFGYTTSLNNTYSNLLLDDVYISSGEITLNITSGDYGSITVNGNNKLKITEALIDKINVNGEYNEVTLYPLVTLNNPLVSNNQNDITTSVSSSLNFINLITKSITTFNSDSALNISMYHEYDNTSNYERSLVFSNDLPINTSIILRRLKGNVITNYYYKNSSPIEANSPIPLTEFKKLGTNTSFTESANPYTVETIDLIINFEYTTNLSSGKVTYACGDAYSTTTYIVDDTDAFDIADFTVQNSKISGGDITAQPAVYSNYYYGKDAVAILTINNGSSDIPFTISDGANNYKPINGMVIVPPNTLDSLIIRGVDGKSLPQGTYTLTARLSMTKDNRVNKYSVLDGIVVSKAYSFTVNNANRYGLSFNEDNNRIININNSNVFSFKLTKTNLNNGVYQINAYKKESALTYNPVAENGWEVAETTSGVDVTIPQNAMPGTYKIVLSYVIDGQKVIEEEYNIIIKDI